ncbi:Uncharacterised protein [Mycobacteroides abscessus subsp. abscessus]|nr:Uncharacterised protein [Mycobacteroides abscessus subsp. abscessus]
MGNVTIRRRPGQLSRRAQKMPLTARLSLSVPPAVKITSEGRAPSCWARDSRASSIRRRAARPEVCSDDALPPAARTAVIASMAAGCIGVVAAWSRYTGLMACPGYRPGQTGQAACQTALVCP